MDAIASISCKLSRKHQSREEWLDEEARNHAFVVVLFYRGSWKSSRWEYLSAFNAILPELRDQGGELFAVVPKNKADAKKMKKHLGLDFKVVSDPDDQLARKYNITVSKHEPRFRSLFPCTNTPSSPSFVRRSMPLIPTSISKDLFQCGHPGVLVISTKRTQAGDWTTSHTIKNQYDDHEKFCPLDLQALLDMHNGRRPHLHPER